MMEELLISIDLPQIDSQITEVTASYTSLGSALRDISSLSSLAENEFKSGSSVKSENMKEVNANLALNEVGNLVNLQTSEMRRLRIQVDALKDASLGSPSATAPGIVGLGAFLVKKSVEVVSRVSNADDQVERNLKALAKQQTGFKKILVKTVIAVRNELQAFRDEVKGLAGKIPGVDGGSFTGTLIAAMALNYMEAKRKQAERGEMTNVFATGMESIYDSAVQKSSNSFAAFGEMAQRSFATGRKEVQGTIQMALDNGVIVAELEKRFSKDLGMVGDNIVKLSIGLAKHFNYSSMESIEAITTLMREYGETTESAAEGLMRMNAAGVRSGIGANAFKKATLSAADPVSSMGVSALEVGELIEKTINYLKSKGLSSQYAGTQAVEVVSDLMSAISGLNDKMKIMLAKEMGIGNEGDSSISLINQFMDGLTRKGGPSQEFIQKVTTAMYNRIVGGIVGPRAKKIEGAEQLIGVTNRTATLFLDAGKFFAEGGKLSEMEEEQQKGLIDAYKTESKQMSDLEKTKFSLMRTMSIVGGAIMSILVNIISLMMVGLKSLAAWTTASGSDRQAIAQSVSAEVSKYTHNMSQSWDKLKDGFSKSMDVIGNEFKGTFQVVTNILKDDFNKKMTTPGGFPGGKGGKGGTPPAGSLINLLTTLAVQGTPLEDLMTPSGPAVVGEKYDVRPAGRGDWGSRYQTRRPLTEQEYYEAIKEFFAPELSYAKRSGNTKDLNWKLMRKMQDARDAELAYRYKMAGGYGSTSEAGGLLGGESGRGSSGHPNVQGDFTKARAWAFHDALIEAGFSPEDAKRLQQGSGQIWEYDTVDPTGTGPDKATVDIPIASDMYPTYFERIELEVAGGSDGIIDWITGSEDQQEENSN